MFPNTPPVPPSTPPRLVIPLTQVQYFGEDEDNEKVEENAERYSPVGSPPLEIYVNVTDTDEKEKGEEEEVENSDIISSPNVSAATPLQSERASSTHLHGSSSGSSSGSSPVRIGFVHHAQSMRGLLPGLVIRSSGSEVGTPPQTARFISSVRSRERYPESLSVPGTPRARARGNLSMEHLNENERAILTNVDYWEISPQTLSTKVDNPAILKLILILEVHGVNYQLQGDKLIIPWNPFVDNKVPETMLPTLLSNLAINFISEHLNKKSDLATCSFVSYFDQIEVEQVVGAKGHPYVVLPLADLPVVYLATCLKARFSSKTIAQTYDKAVIIDNHLYIRTISNVALQQSCFSEDIKKILFLIHAVVEPPVQRVRIDFNRDIPGFHVMRGEITFPLVPVIQQLVELLKKGIDLEYRVTSDQLRVSVPTYWRLVNSGLTPDYIMMLILHDGVEGVTVPDDVLYPFQHFLRKILMVVDGWCKKGKQNGTGNPERLDKVGEQLDILCKFLENLFGYLRTPFSSGFIADWFRTNSLPKLRKLEVDVRHASIEEYRKCFQNLLDGIKNSEINFNQQIIQGALQNGFIILQELLDELIIALSASEDKEMVEEMKIGFILALRYLLNKSIAEIKSPWKANCVIM